LRELIDKQQHKTLRTDKADAIEALAELGISLDCELAELLLERNLCTLYSEGALSDLVDISSPNRDIELSTNFVHSVWELPERYLCISSCQGEGGYLYDRSSHEVIDFELATRTDFLAGNYLQKWDTFYEFLIWFLSASPPE
jgi:hypothetical protein